VKPTAAQPSRSASLTEPVTADFGLSPEKRLSLLLSLRISGILPAKLRAPASRKPSGAA
jgi:hypothetical protein